MFTFIIKYSLKYGFYKIFGPSEKVISDMVVSSDSLVLETEIYEREEVSSVCVFCKFLHLCVLIIILVQHNISSN